MVNRMFASLIGQTMEVDIDDILVKCLRAVNHVEHLKPAFNVLMKYQMKLNPLKCALT